ncbi:GNAT family N-acetyltransferase [Paenibacillus thailandensis]|jgi:N-acetylglutamate synthase-like GNAT family acetyltransferase|uniref:GNAT family N-acetyltransferase n=1 Tax=Paenibacillus thailandensis TaxID=393250 RepID=A0ABW5QVV2_9BACL
MERKHELLPYWISDSKERLDRDKIAELLGTAYWSSKRSRATIEAGIDASLCFGIYDENGQQAGFSRVITDGATFSYICDVIIDPGHRGKGLGKWLVRTMLAHPDVQPTNKMLATRDAHGLYEQFGFQRAEALRLERAATP